MTVGKTNHCSLPEEEILENKQKPPPLGLSRHVLLSHCTGQSQPPLTGLEPFKKNELAITMLESCSSKPLVRLSTLSWIAIYCHHHLLLLLSPLPSPFLPTFSSPTPDAA